MVHTGECPGKGIYICADCGVSIKLETDTTEMPECPECGCQDFIATK